MAACSHPLPPKASMTWQAIHVSNLISKIIIYLFSIILTSLSRPDTGTDLGKYDTHGGRRLCKEILAKYVTYDPHDYILYGICPCFLHDLQCSALISLDSARVDSHWGCIVPLNWCMLAANGQIQHRHCESRSFHWECSGSNMLSVFGFDQQADFEYKLYVYKVVQSRTTTLSLSSFFPHLCPSFALMSLVVLTTLMTILACILLSTGSHGNIPHPSAIIN